MRRKMMQAARSLFRGLKASFAVVFISGVMERNYPVI